MRAIQGFIAWALLRLVYPKALAQVREVAVLPLRGPRIPEGAPSSPRLGRQSQVLATAPRSARPSRRPRCRVYETGGGIYQLHPSGGHLGASATPYAALLASAQAKHTAEARNG